MTKVLERSNAVRVAASGDSDLRRAIASVKQDLFQPQPSLVILFCNQDLHRPTLETALGNQFPDSIVIGATAAGVVAKDGYGRSHIAGISLAAPDFRAASRTIENIADFQLSSGYELVQALRADLAADAPEANDSNTFAVLLIDSGPRVEDRVLSAVRRALGGIPLFGGSAADRFDFAERTFEFNESWVYSDGRFRNKAAVLTLVHTTHRFEVFSTHNLASTGTRAVVTRAEPSRRIVWEVNAEPALDEYARLSGFTPAEFREAFPNIPQPAVKLGDSFFVRAIERINDDGSMIFACAIDEGIVFHLTEPKDMVDDLRTALDGVSARVGEPEVIIGCDCAYRRLELQDTGRVDAASEVLARNKVIAFGSFGEQLNSMHMNLTFTGIAIGGDNAQREDEP